MSPKEAEDQFEALLAAAERGEDVVIERGGEPVARLVGLAVNARLKALGSIRFRIPDSFFEPMPESMLDEFERPLLDKPT